MAEVGCTADGQACAIDRLTGGLCRQLIDESPVAMAIISGPEMTVRYANRRYRSLDPERPMEGRPLADVWPEAVETFLPVVRAAILEGRSISDKDRRLDLTPHLGGSAPLRYFTFSGRPLKYAGEPAVLIEAVETTDEVNARLASDEYGATSERHAQELDRVLERIGDGFFALDRHWHFTYVNKRAEELFRRDRDELIGKELSDVFPGGLGTGFRSAYQRALIDRGPTTFEDYYEPLRLAMSMRIYPDDDGVAVFFVDMGAERRREAELAGLRERATILARYLETSSQPFAAGTPDGRITMVNHAFAEMVGYSEEDLLSGRVVLSDLNSTETAAFEKEHLEVLARTGEPVRYEKQYVRNDGSTVYASVLVHVVRDNDGVVESFYSFMTDITARHQAEILQSALTEIDALIHSTLRFDEIMRRSLSAAARVLGADSGNLVVYDEQDSATVRYLYPDEGGPVKIGQVFTVEEAPFTRLIREGRRPLIVADATTHQAFVPELHEQYGLVGFLAIPLIMRGEVFAGIGLNFAVPREFDAAESDFIDKLGSSISLALENAQLYREREAAMAELERQDRAIRAAYSDALAAVTGGRLVLLGDEELDAALLPLELGPRSVDSASHLAGERAELRRALGGAAGADDLLLSFGEALTNSLKHAGGGVWELRRAGDAIQVVVSDKGDGIDFRRLPRAALVAGFSTKQSLGVGFTIMLELSDRILLCTNGDGTTVVIERRLTAPEARDESRGRPGSKLSEELELLGTHPDVG